MKVFTTANQKGGVGKTAFQVHFAWYLQEKGFKVAIIDLDTQGNASFTLGKYLEKTLASSFFENMGSDFKFSLNNEKISLFASDPLLADMEKKSLSEAANNFKKNIEKIAPFFDYCLIDTAPSFGNLLVSALITSNYVVSPIELETYSIQGIQKMGTTIKNISEINKNLVFLGMLPSKVDNRNKRHKSNLSALKEAYSDLLIPYQISLRSSVADALAYSMPVWKIKKKSAKIAADEIGAVCEYLVKKMEN